MTLGQDSRSYRIRMLPRMCLFRCKDNAFSRLPGAAKQHGCLLTQIHLNPHWQSNVIIQRREKCAAGCQDNQVAAPAAAVCLAEVFIFPIFIFHSFFFFYSSRRFYCRPGWDNPYWHIYARFKQRNGNFWRRMARWHLPFAFHGGVATS